MLIIILASACQPTSEPLPTVLFLPTPTPVLTESPAQNPVSTAALPATVDHQLPLEISTETPTFTITPTPTATTAATETPSPTITPTIVVINLIQPTATARFLPENFVFGRSLEGRDLTARRVGEGSTIIMMVGGIHGGWESNTVTLVEEMITHFQITPGDLLPGVTLLFVPALNPDGVARGRTLEGRFNSNNVDLNRNWGCGWQPVAYFRDQEVNPGSQPFSEPETLALAALINDLRPAAVLFYHSAADGIFAGDCNNSGTSDAMTSVYGDASGYNYGVDFTEYVVTGTAPSWVDSLGIPSADVELATANATELERNLRGVIAVQCWLLGNPVLPACAGFSASS
ncbi:MAG: hypothetical protein OHK0046_22770 [Anaerolineae bacterium]